jgi:acyl-CoA-binding protein
MFNIIDSAKCNTWNNINGMDTETAMKIYINKVKELLQKKNWRIIFDNYYTI